MEDKQVELELIEFVIDDSFGEVVGDLSLISIVKNPAIERSFHLFSKQKKELFKVVDAEKQIIVGPAMTPNMPILRQDEVTKQYYNCFFTEETVRKCSELFLKNSNGAKTNLEHGTLLTSNQIEGAYVVQSWLVQNPASDAALSYGFSDIKKGDWFVAFKIESPTLWAIIKEQGFSGFSVEGDFLEKFSHFSKSISDKGLESLIKAIVFDKEMTETEKELAIKKII